MKFTMGRTMKIVVAVLIVAVIAIVMLSPYSLKTWAGIIQNRPGLHQLTL